MTTDFRDEMSSVRSQAKLTEVGNVNKEARMELLVQTPVSFQKLRLFRWMEEFA